MIFNARQQHIARKLDPDANLATWRDWHWHIRHTIRDVDRFAEITGIEFAPAERNKLRQTLDKFPLSLNPYYLSLIDTADYANDPIYLQSVPMPSELTMSQYEMSDPLAEDKDSPVPFLTHRYPDRVLLHVSNICAMYCRHCTRKRKVGDSDSIPAFNELEPALDYIRKHPAIRDVLLSGGDPLMLSDKAIEAILAKVRAINHVEIIRIGSRMPVVLPYRISADLVNILKRYQPLYLNTHFNHPRELTRSSQEALSRLTDNGIVLGNQSVLLAGINDCPRIIRKLCHELLRHRVRPYYLYQCDLSEGLAHFRTPVGKGIEILESMIGHTSGLAIPTYVIDAPGGGGKIPVMPNYLISWSTNKVILRNYEGVITTYKEPDSYEPTFCDRNCDKCDLQLNLTEAEAAATTGVEELLSDASSAISLTPAENSRLRRRDKNGGNS
jgi:lysine 2,3-aminomutase